MGDLLARYDGVEDALGDVAVATEITGRLHRPEGDGDPWCGTAADRVEYVETEVALEYGASLCGRCYRPALAHLARMSSSPVEDRLAEGDAPAAVSTDVSELEPPSADPRPVGAITAEVLVGVGGRRHVPRAGRGRRAAVWRGRRHYSSPARPNAAGRAAVFAVLLQRGRRRVRRSRGRRARRRRGDRRRRWVTRLSWLLVGRGLAVALLDVRRVPAPVVE